jgi:Xaa-Pro aminopeptidase
MPKDEFARRRRQLMRLMGRDSIAILPAAPVRQRNNDVEYAYRQDSDFYYLTGFGEPESVAVLIPGREQAEYILFVRDRDPKRVPRAPPVSTAPTMRSRSLTSMKSFRGFSRTTRRSSTPWACIRTSISGSSAG